jgi:hypothetical protein
MPQTRHAPEPPPIDTDAAQEEGRIQAAARIAGDFLLRSVLLLSERGEGDLMLGLIWLAIVQGNIAHIDRGGAARTPASAGTPPDSLRRPVSVLSVAASLGLPYETTRRHVRKLQQMGVCHRVKGGVLISGEMLDKEHNLVLLRQNLTNLKRLFRDLEQAGVDLG